MPPDDVIEVPYARLAPETLRALIEEFVTRDTTDYGAYGKSLDEEVADVMRQLEHGADSGASNSIDHTRLLDRVARCVRDRGVLNLVGKYLRRTAETGGWYWTAERGLSLGCPLSPVLGAFFLLDLDRAFEQSGLFYVRFMDDIVVLAPTRWKLRAAVRQVQQRLTALGLATHPDKTFIGRVERGFDFLGYSITPQGLSVAPTTWAKFCDRAYRLFEQEQGKPEGFPLLGAYVHRWRGWAEGFPEWRRLPEGERVFLSRFQDVVARPL